LYINNLIQQARQIPIISVKNRKALQKP